MPSRRSPSISTKISSTIFGAKPSVGSSISNSRGAPTSTRHGQHLLLATRQRRAHLVAPFTQSGKSRVDRVEGAPIFGAAATRDLHESKHQVLLHRQAREDAPVFWHEANAAPADAFRRQAIYGLPLQPHRSAARCYPAGDSLHHRGLAHAVTAEQAYHFAGPDIESHPLQHVAQAVMGMDVTQLKHGQPPRSKLTARLDRRAPPLACPRRAWRPGA